MPRSDCGNLPPSVAQNRQWFRAGNLRVGSSVFQFDRRWGLLLDVCCGGGGVKPAIDGNRGHVHHVGTGAGGIAGTGDFVALLSGGGGGGALGGGLRGRGG